MSERDDFYVGWEASMSAATRRFVRRVVVAAFAGATAIAGAIAALQAPFAAGVFEYGDEREFVGVVRETPAPQLVVSGPACTELCSARSAWLLARYGAKRGAAELVRGLDGRVVRLRGVLVYRGDQTLLDVVPGSVQAIGDAAGAPAPPAVAVELGERRLRGEIVDAKCHFGVMRPGSGKTHRACAARCIASGSPPLLWVRDAARGRELHLLLVGADGRALGRELLPWVGEAIEVSGRVVRRDDLLVLHAEPAAFRREARWAAR
ncbi:MAG: hypothetical protein DCC71_23980 [Proteobacteria bacterium]|nr:MAG: hypothetical protein DCC71_23980 [Pseudomonadota bacterium]